MERLKKLVEETGIVGRAVASLDRAVQQAKKELARHAPEENVVDDLVSVCNTVIDTLEGMGNK